MILLPQLRKGSAHQSGCRSQEDYEAFQHSRPLQAHIPGIETPQAPAPRECKRWVDPESKSKIDPFQVISLSDIFISPLEDM